MSLTRSKPMARTAFKSATPRTQAPADEPKPEPGPRKKRCKHCRTAFVADPAWLDHCSDDCGVALGLQRVAKQKAKALRQDRAETKAKLAKFKSIPTLKAEVQVVFNAYIRLRDEIAGYGCICCGKFNVCSDRIGGSYDAAHYRSRGSADHLRYNENNVHRSLKYCNTYGHHDYRGGLIARIGLPAVEALEQDQTIVKWTKAGLEAMKAHYTAELKRLKGKQS